ncbi:MAG: hypothetical protein ACUVRG_09590 [Ignavibacterium sp.]|uniref:hypothetical protein n=1 Tax=Ignavibacterium sp. TaxID=2651167 RepID=UPI004049DC9C
MNKKILIDYFAKERLGLNDKIIYQVLNKFKAEFENWKRSISISFISNDMKDKYLKLINKRKEALNF